MNAKTRKY